LGRFSMRRSGKVLDARAILGSGKNQGGMTASAKTRIVLADDHAMMREGVASLSQHMTEFEVMAQAANGLELLERVEEHRPDMVALDISMPAMTGTDAAARIARDYPEVRTIALSMHKTEDWVLRALRAGVQGYVTKDATAVELREACERSPMATCTYPPRSPGGW
jgi:DNA-binding NarL/FixJ family response regulator